MADENKAGDISKTLEGSAVHATTRGQADQDSDGEKAELMESGEAGSGESIPADGGSAKAQAEAKGVHFWLALYLLISSTMLIVNKGVMLVLPFTNLALALQAAASVGILHLARSQGHCDFDDFNMVKGKKWTTVMLAWLFPMICNMQALKYTNVETVIIFRMLSIVAIACGDVYWFNKTFSQRAQISMGVLVLGGLVYALNDSFFDPLGYIWSFAYFFATVLNALYIKWVFNTVPQMGNWEKTYYNNLMGIPVLLFQALVTESIPGFFSTLLNMDLPSLIMVIVSCIMGFGISLAGTMCRDLVSATSFNVAGNVNKFLTVLLSMVMFNSYPGAVAVLGLLMALGGGASYAFS